MNRRDLLRLGRRVLGWLAVLAAAWPALRFATWREKTARAVVFPGREAADHAFKDGVFLLRTERGYAALSAVCPHLCCTVAYDERIGEFRCPCHRSVFDRRGRRLAGPAGRDLDELPVERRKDGSLRVEAPR